MKYTKLQEGSYFLRLEKDEELVQSLKAFCQRQGVTSGYVQGIGGLQTARLGVYRLSGSKEYEFTDFSGDLEMISLQGNVSLDEEGSHMLHLHAVVGNEQLSTVGGHFDSGVVGGTVELMVTAFVIPFTRVLDDEIGLKLINFDTHE